MSEKKKHGCRALGVAAILWVTMPQAFAADLEIEVEIPQLKVAEYHKPYVAFWLEAEGQKPTNLAVWYDLKLKNEEGQKWLKDLRQWWRKSGRELKVPIDGMTSATRAPGKHKLSYSGKAAALQIPPGEYRLMVEASREVGGREILSLPFSWPPKKHEQIQAQGKSELGSVSLELKP